MSLYYEAAAVLVNADGAGGSLKSRIFNSQKSLKSSPPQLYALVSEASKWSVVLKDVIERSGVLKAEKKLTPILALLLTHDLILSKNGIAAPTNHVLNLAIKRHKARLNAEFTKARIRAGYGSIELFRGAINAGSISEESANAHDTPNKGVQHPRWIRINTLKTSLAEQLASTFEEYEQKHDLQDIVRARGTPKIYHVDKTIPNLIALPEKTDLSKSKAYINGHIIFQDKASCFPAYLLDPSPLDGMIIDATAAPGNKTTHLASILAENGLSESSEHKVEAFERDKTRAQTLDKMVELASADSIVNTRKGQDFLATNPDDYWAVGGLLLDPSCSGSGIVGRDDALKIYLPDTSISSSNRTNVSTGKKRKLSARSNPSNPEALAVELQESPAEEEDTTAAALSGRLDALAAFQLSMIKHAMAFINARKISYSTCSIHFEENESVVLHALASDIAKKRGWRILKREEQVEGLKTWKIRGKLDHEKIDDTLVISDEKKDVLAACIRCEKSTEEGTMGFFLAGFVRDTKRHIDFVDGTIIERHNSENDHKLDQEEDEWNGFSDDADAVHEELLGGSLVTEQAITSPLNKRPRREYRW